MTASNPPGPTLERVLKIALFLKVPRVENWKGISKSFCQDSRMRRQGNILALAKSADVGDLGKSFLIFEPDNIILKTLPFRCVQVRISVPSARKHKR